MDSCAGEVEAASSYYYSTWGEADEAPPHGEKPRVVILGSGPNRIGQGIEFDYCCVHAAQSFRRLGYEAVMVNCNPETVSTDYDTSDRLYFEPLGLEEVLSICERERPEGVAIQFGGQTPLKLARGLEAAGHRIIGTPFDAVDVAEDRERFGALLERLGVRCPEWGIARDGSGGAGDRGTHRVPDPGSPVVRARWACDARLLLGGGPRADREPGSDRPLHRERDRDRRRRGLRRARHLCRRGDATRRGGRRALRRFGVRPAGPVARTGAGRARSA